MRGRDLARTVQGYLVVLLCCYAELCITVMLAMYLLYLNEKIILYRR